MFSFSGCLSLSFPVLEIVTLERNSECKRNECIGATSGIGQEVARVLAKRGARVVLAVRNAEKAQKVMSLILEETPSARLEFIHLNLASLKSVRDFAAEFLSRDLPLNILV